MSSSIAPTQNGTLNEKNEVTGTDQLSQSTWNPRFSLAKLSEPARVEVILHNRRDVASFLKLGEIPATTLDTLNPAGNDQLPTHFSDLESVTLNEMYPTGCNYYGKRIDLEIIDDATSLIRVMLMCQDGAGDVIFVALYCDSPSRNDIDLQQKLGYGCKISIANPWMKVALDGRIMIRIDDDSNLLIHKSKDPKKCRFCGNPDSEKKCARCKKAFYCSRECQIHDWKILNHKGICDVYKH